MSLATSGPALSNTGLTTTKPSLISDLRYTDIRSQTTKTNTAAMASANRDSPEPDPNPTDNDENQNLFTINHEGRTITHREYIDLMTYAHDVHEAARRAVGPYLTINYDGETLTHQQYVDRIAAERARYASQQPTNQPADTGARPKTKPAESLRINPRTGTPSGRVIPTLECLNLLQRAALDQLPAQQLGSASITRAIASATPEEITLGDGSIFNPQLGIVRPPDDDQPPAASNDSDADVIVEGTVHSESFNTDNEDQMLVTAATLAENDENQDPNNPTPDGAHANIPSLPPTDDEDEQDDTESEDDLPDFADGNFLQQPIPGVPHIIRQKVDISLVKRIIMVTLMNGDPNTTRPTVLRAKELIDVLFHVSGGVPKPLTSGFYLNLSTQENRAISIARTSYLLPRATTYRDILPWLNSLPNLINEAVNGITLPTAMALTDEDLARFAAYHAPEFYDTAVAHGDDLDLCRIVTNSITMVYPLIYKEGDSDQAVPLFKVVFLGREHVPPDYRTELVLQNIPEVIINNQVQETPSYIVPHLQTYKKINHDIYLNEIRHRISTAFNTTGQPLNMIADAFRRGQFLTYLGNNPAHLNPHDPDAQIIHVSIEQAPWQEHDVYTAAINKFGANWENTIRQQSHINRPVELTFPTLQRLRESRRVYTTKHKGTPYLIREWDTASLICDYSRTHEGRLTPRVLCIIPENRRLPQMDGITADWHGEFSVEARHDELTWPNWTEDIRRHGQYIRRLTPGGSRHIPIRTLRAGHTDWDLLIALGDAIPFNFNRLSLHSNEIVYRPGQHVCDPHDVESYQYLPERDRFIATGPSHAIPQAQVLPGQYMLLKRCGLCNWIYGRTVQCLPCGHLYCTVCLGLTSLVTVDKMVCLFCWTVPERVRGKSPHK